MKGFVTDFEKVIVKDFETETEKDSVRVKQRRWARAMERRN